MHFFATVQNEGGRSVERNVEYFNLDAIISVGYRVNSKRGTQFRIWATNVLRKHLLDGYTINERRLKSQSNKVKELQQAVQLLTHVKSLNQLTRASDNCFHEFDDIGARNRLGL